MLTHLPFGAYNMRYQENSEEFSQMPNGTSDNANIKRNFGFCSKGGLSR